MPKLLVTLTSVQHQSLLALATAQTTSMQRLTASAIDRLLEGSDMSIRPTTPKPPDPILKVIAAISAIVKAAADTGNSQSNLAALLRCKSLVREKEGEFKAAETNGGLEHGTYRSLAASLTMRSRHMATFLKRTPH